MSRTAIPNWTTYLNHFPQTLLAEEWKFTKQGPLGRKFDLTSKPDELVYFRFVSDSNEIYEYRLWFLNG